MHITKPRFRVQVILQYIPALQTKIPSYGIHSADNGTTLIVSVSDMTPPEAIPLLESELKKELSGLAFTDTRTTAQYAERLTHDFFHAQVVCGNLRFDKATQVWRWIASNPADSRDL